MDEKQKRRARRMFYRAVVSGKIIPEENCNKCGQNPGFGKDGRRLIQGHHHKGYAEEFIYDVEWLCPSCHKICHGNTDWEKHPESKAKMIASVSKPKNLSESQREGYADRCLETKPWLARWGHNPPCPQGHTDNFGKNCRGHRYCKTCQKDRRKVS